MDIAHMTYTLTSREVLFLFWLVWALMCVCAAAFQSGRSAERGKRAISIILMVMSLLLIAGVVYCAYVTFTER